MPKIFTEERKQQLISWLEKKKNKRDTERMRRRLDKELSEELKAIYDRDDLSKIDTTKL